MYINIFGILTNFFELKNYWQGVCYAHIIPPPPATSLSKMQECVKNSKPKALHFCPFGPYLAHTEFGVSGDCSTMG
jgi:hypothetical protein